MVQTALVVAADDALRTVLALALQSDGYRVQSAAGNDCARERLAAESPDLLVVDALTPLPAPAAQWAADVAGSRPLLLLVSDREDLPPIGRPNAVALAMPFGRDALRGAVARALSATPAPEVAPAAGAETSRTPARTTATISETPARLLPALRFVGYAAVVWNLLLGVTTDHSSSIVVALCALLVLLASFIRQTRQELVGVAQQASR
jgi:DNA-binding NtrC family response regulator